MCGRSQDCKMVLKSLEEDVRYGKVEEEGVRMGKWEGEGVRYGKVGEGRV